MSEHPIAVVILAGGASNRMGQPKQLLEYQGETMVERIIRIALSTNLDPVVLVLGAQADRIEKAVKTKAVHIAYNDDWPLGMSTSLRTGLEKALQLQPDLQAILFLVVDQPYVSGKLLLQIVEQYRTHHPLIVAARYDEKTGVPALIDRELFEELRNLSGDQGARPLLDKYEHRLLSVAFPRGAVDLDTPSDYEDLHQRD